MKNTINPFELFSYQGPKYFCDREDDVSRLNEAFENRRNTVLSSMRRLGKTSLIMHWHAQLSKSKNLIPIYIDVLGTKSDKEFIDQFVLAIVKAYSNKENFTQKLLSIFGRLRPQISLDPYTGSPQVSLDIQTNVDKEASFDIALNLLSESKEQFQIAIDEFQIIETYEPPSSIDAILRSHFPKLKNIHFLFCGSQQHMLSTIFSNPKRPMFSSTQHLTLDRIPYPSYFDFIKNHFEENQMEISDQSIHEILTWTQSHTFYTHFLANEIFSKHAKKVTYELVKKSEMECLQLFAVNYEHLLSTLPGNQAILLKAIASEKSNFSINEKSFLNKYKLSASSASLALKGLIDKDFLIVNNVNQPTYYIQDVFFAKYLEQL